MRFLTDHLQTREDFYLGLVIINLHQGHLANDRHHHHQRKRTMRPIPMLATTSLLLFATLIPAADVKPAQAAIRPDLIALKVIAALRANDLEQAFKALPADLQKTAEADYEKQRTAQEGPLAAWRPEFDQQLARYRAANAVDDLVGEYTKALETGAADKTGVVMMLRSSGVLISPILTELAKSEPKFKGLDSTLIELSLDIAKWIETTDEQDPKKLRQFVTHQVAAFKALKIQSSADLVKLSLPEALRATSPMVTHFKAGMQVYGIQADAFLDSIKITAKESNKGRELDISFSAFGKPRNLWLPFQHNWKMDPALLAPLMPTGPITE
jgi:hypothetical protein